MNYVELFLAEPESVYKTIEGAITPLTHFRHKFIDWLDCPARQNFWTQKRRVEAALRSLGFPIAYQLETSGGRYGVTRGECGQLYIGNLGERVQPGQRRFVVEDGYLTQLDYTE